MVIGKNRGRKTEVEWVVAFFSIVCTSWWSADEVIVLLSFVIHSRTFCILSPIFLVLLSRLSYFSCSFTRTDLHWCLLSIKIKIYIINMIIMKPVTESQWVLSLSSIKKSFVDHTLLQNNNNIGNDMRPTTSLHLLIGQW